MSFTSAYFLIFVTVAVAAYYAAPKEKRWIVLLIASALFYLASGVKYFVFIAFSTVTTYYTGICLNRLNKKQPLPFVRRPSHTPAKTKNHIVAITLLLNFGILVFLKYYNFIGANVNLIFDAFAWQPPAPKLDLLLPLGISFYTFQAAGYVIDAYRGKIEVSKSLAKYALFTSFFPQIIQGPISKYNELGAQLQKPSDFRWNNIKYGIQLMLWGYIKKLVVADRLAVIVDQIYGDFTSYGGLTLFIATFLYSVQLYCDFSGGIDIAAGVANLLGIQLIQNFKRPFFAISIDDYWRRWHISLGRWMKDYVFYPLSFSGAFTKLGRVTRKIFGNSIGKVLPACIATFIVFILVGVWQGANWKFIIYGMWNGGLISLSMLLSKRFKAIKAKLRIGENGNGWRIFCVMRTIILITLGRYFSRADSVTDALRMVKRLFVNFMPAEPFQGVFMASSLDTADYCAVLLGIILMCIAGAWQEKGIIVRERLEQQRPFVQVALLFSGLLLVVYFGIYTQGYIPSDFIYRNV